MEAGMRISINGVELVLPDDQPVRIDSGVVSVGAAIRTAPLQLEHTQATAQVEKKERVPYGTGPKGRAVPTKTLHTTDQVKDGVVKLIRAMGRPVTTRTFSMKMKFAEQMSDWRRKRYIDTLLRELVSAGVVVGKSDGRNWWGGLPGMNMDVIRQPSGHIGRRSPLPVADDDVAA